MSGVAWGDVATWVSGVATVGAVVFAGLQVRLVRREQEHERALELRSVTLAWQPTSVETEGHADELGRAKSVYEFVVHNPGRLAITDISVLVTFPCDVERTHYDGSADGPTRTLVLETPVVAGGSSRSWRRGIRLLVRDREVLRQTTAVLTFLDLDKQRHESHWGRGVG
jgi:hypothetical protein